jgi:hypothetical protein
LQDRQVIIGVVRNPKECCRTDMLSKELLETLRNVAGETIQWLKEKDKKYLKTQH